MDISGPSFAEGTQQGVGNVRPGASGSISVSSSSLIVPAQSTSAAILPPHHAPPSAVGASIFRASTPNGQRAKLWLYSSDGAQVSQQELRRSAPTNLLNRTQAAIEQQVWQILDSAHSHVRPASQQTTDEGITTAAFALSSNGYFVPDADPPRVPASRDEHQYQIAVRCYGDRLLRMHVKARGETNFVVHYTDWGALGSQRGSAGLRFSAASIGSSTAGAWSEGGTSPAWNQSSSSHPRTGQSGGEELARTLSTEVLLRTLIDRRNPRDREFRQPDGFPTSSRAPSESAGSAAGQRRAASGSPVGEPPAQRQRVEAAWLWTSPKLTLSISKDESLEIAAALVATPLYQDEHELLCTILGATKRDVKVGSASGGSKTLQFNAHVGDGSVWKACLYLDEDEDAKHQPVSLQAWSGQDRIELRWPHRTDEQWLEATAESYGGAMPGASTFVNALAADGPTLRELGLEVDQNDNPPLGMLEATSDRCLRAVLLSMAARSEKVGDEDPVGAQVCAQLEIHGATAATLHRLDKAQLVATLQALAEQRNGHLPLDVSDLRWLPQTCVGSLIARLMPGDNYSKRARDFLSEVLTLSEPTGAEKAWPVAFTGGVRASSGYISNVHELREMHERYLATFDSQERTTMVRSHITSVNVLLRNLGNCDSVVDPPKTEGDVAGLSNVQLTQLGTSNYATQRLKGGAGLLSWLKSQ